MSRIVFKLLDKGDKQIIDSFFHARYYENSHFTFTNLYMWREPYHIKWAVDDGVLFMTAEWQGRLMALQPFGPEEKLVVAVKKLHQYFLKQEKVLSFTGIESSFANLLQNLKDLPFDVQVDRDNFDYVYDRESLTTLAGRKYHSKKNHLNAFRKNYPQAEYLPITEDIITQCKIELNNWYKLRAQELDGDEFIRYERAAIIEVLNNFSDFNLRGGALRLDHRVIAFTFGEQLNEDTAVIHVEKADPDIRGAYPAINQGFVATDWQEMKYINREEDMGIPGLRKAKESYKPIKLVEKFNAKLVTDKI